jgi:hypothetical protein
MGDMLRIASKDSPILSYFKADCPPKKLGQKRVGSDDEVVGVA